MAVSLVHRNHRIVVSTRLHQFTKRWVAVVVISWSEKGTDKVHSIKDWLRQFESLRDAEDWAIENAKAWIDQHAV